MNNVHPFPKINQVFPGFPAALINHLRQVMKAPSAFEAFRVYCNLLEWLTTYLANLANSIYKDRPSEQVDERLEVHLRGASLPISFGTAVGGLRAFAQSSVDYSTQLPELGAIFSERLPSEPARMVKAFQAIRKAREQYHIPPGRLGMYLKDNNPADNAVGKCSLDAFLSEIVIYRNRGLAHQTEEGWFPNDPQMYTILVGYLAPAIDDLLSWGPMSALLTNYEVVDAGPEISASAGSRACDVTRSSVTEGFAPLGPSYLVLGVGHQPEGRYVVRRANAPRELHAVVRYVHFPQTLQTSDLLFRRYARHYLMAYLERGLITRTQRQRELEPLIRKLTIPDSERQRIETEIQQVIDKYKPDDLTNRDALQQQLAALLGLEWQQVQAQVPALLAQMPQRRKDHIFEEIENSAIMSFEQLRAESELSEPELDSVLLELEQDGRVRQVGTPNARIRANFKAQDPQKHASFRALLDEFRTRAHKTRRYPGFVWKLVELCEVLLADDGIVLREGEVVGYRGLFEGYSADGADPVLDQDGDVMLLRVSDEDIRANSVRDLFERVVDFLRKRRVQTSTAIPFLIGRSRYLVNTEPTHANGTSFAAPINIGDLYFEANRTREQALLGTMDFVRRLGLTASSPGIEDRREVEDDDGASIDEDESLASILELEVRTGSTESPRVIKGPTVPKFFASLLDFLLECGAPLDKEIPVPAGRIRYLLAEEPYHSNGRPFYAYIEKDGYYMDTSYTYEQAVAQGARLCERFGFLADAKELVEEQPQVPLRITIGEQVVVGRDAPSFLSAAVTTLYEKGFLTDGDIPYKSGRLRYLISDDPTHDHGRNFIRPVEITLGGRIRFIETNISRQGAVEMIQRLLARKPPPASDAQQSESP